MPDRLRGPNEPCPASEKGAPRADSPKVVVAYSALGGDEVDEVGEAGVAVLGGPQRLAVASSRCRYGFERLLPTIYRPLPAACGCLGGSRYAEQCEALRLRSSDRGLDRTPPYIGRGGSGRWPRPRPRQCPLISSNKFGLLSVRPVSPTPSPFLSPSSWFPEQPRPRPLWKGKGLPVRAGVCC